jgi:hypothetical protein
MKMNNKITLNNGSEITTIPTKNSIRSKGYHYEMDIDNKDFTELHKRYMELQSIPLSKITIKERHELQDILEILMSDKQTTDHDLYIYYMPIWKSFYNDIQQIKQFISHAIFEQEGIIIMAQKRIDELKKKLEE